MSLSQLYIPITVDLSNPYPLPMVHAQQNNIGRGARVTLTNGGTVISPANVTAVTSWATKPDKTVSYLECEVENDQIVLVFTSQMLAVPGDLQVELQLIGDGFNITTPIFLVKVGKSNISEDAILSENELSFVEQLMEVRERLQEDADNGVFDGVGVASVVQTTTSTADDGNNIITMTLTDGTTCTFTIQNGSKGSTGTGVTITSVSESSADGGSNVVTFSDGTTMTVKNGSKGSTGSTGATGVGIASVVQTTTSTADDGNNVVTVTLTDGSTSTFTVQNGSKGSTGASGSDGTDGVSVSSVAQTTTSSADGGTNVITVTLSDGTTSTFNVKNGSKGSTGATGADGSDANVTAENIASALGYTPADQADVDSLSEEIANKVDNTELSAVVNDALATAKASGEFDGADGDDYVLTDADKQDIAELVENVTFYERPAVVSSVDEMTDTSKQYVLESTNTIWEYQMSEVEGTVTDVIESTTDNPASNGYYVNKGALAAKSDSFATPFIDLTKYEGTIKLIVKGATCLYASATAYYQMAFHSADGTYIDRCYMSLAAQSGAYVVTRMVDTVDQVVVDGDTTTFEIALPRYFTTTLIEKIRFGCLGTWETSEISIEYTGMISGYQWVDTGVEYNGSGTSGGVDEETLATIAELNNEGDSPSTIKLLAQPVLDFYNADAYTDGDYTTTHLSAVTYPCRADIPVPYVVKWNYNEDAMRTTVAVDDTKAIGTLNRFTMRTYEATGLNKFPIYNLLPNHTYYYKVTHVMYDGSLVEAKSGSFTTSSETIRLLYIDGTQNVRDLGGWTGLDSQTVKYGMLLRGATFSDSSYPELMLTGKGKRALGDLGILAELNLGATDTETSIASNVAYTKLGYTNYALAITNTDYQTQFKNILEWIVTQLNSSKPIYMHCQGGCDRTGTLAFQLLGLLGVSESDLSKDYELSCFSDIGFGRYRNSTTYDYSGLVSAIKAYDGSTLAEQCYNFAIACGVSADTITSFRSLMLE